MPTIDEMRTALNANYTSINALIPNKYNFTDEPTATTQAITDGGFDMYDTSNVFNTNRTHVYNNVKNNGFSSRISTSIPYTHTKHTNTTFSYNGNGTVNAGTNYFGTGSSYFTNLYPGFFVLIATGISITELSITGNVGCDGGGLLTTDDFTLTVGGNNFAVYRKILYNTTDPSINHFFIIPGSGSGVTHTWDTSKQYDDDVIQNLTGITEIYCIVAASRSSNTGQLISHNDAVNIVTEFLEVIGATGAATEQTITATAIDSAESFGTNSVSSNQTITVTEINSNETIDNHEVESTLESPTSINSQESFSTHRILNTITAMSIYADDVESSEAVPNAILKNTIEINSITTAESIANTHVKPVLEPTEIDSEEDFETLEIINTIEVNSISENQFGTLKANQYLQNVVEIATEEAVSQAHVKLQIVPTFTNEQIFGTISFKQNVKFLTTQPVSAGESFDEPNVKRYFFVTSLNFCMNDSNSPRCNKIKNAIVPAITILNQKLFMRDFKPIPSRLRQGFYVDYDVYFNSN